MDPVIFLKHTKSSDSSETKKLCNIDIPDKFYNRYLTGLESIDTLFGGEETPGIIPGTVYLFTGMPGAGKSTLCLQLADRFKFKSVSNVLYNVGEESPYMVKMAADRLGILGDFDISHFKSVDELCNFVRKNDTDILIVDSLQTLQDEDVSGTKLLRNITIKLTDLAKEKDTVIFIVGHITKGGDFAGPQAIKHIVDAHAHLSINNETGNRIFELTKNRFGPSGIKYEFSFSARGLNFNRFSINSDNTKENKSSKKNIFVEKAKELMLEGIKLSGYSYEELKQIKDIGNISGVSWRQCLKTASEELKNDGHIINNIRINGRTNFFVEV